MRKVIVVAVLLLVDLKTKKTVKLCWILFQINISGFSHHMCLMLLLAAAVADDDVAVAVCRKFSAREHTILAIATYTYARDLISHKNCILL